MVKKNRKSRKGRKSRKSRKSRKRRKKYQPTSRYLKDVAKRIRIDGETWESAMERAMYLQAAAPSFEPEKWNSDKNVKHPHNCYTYAIDKTDPELTQKCKEINCKPRNALKPQPGYHSGHQRIKDKSKYNCPLVMNRVLDDNPYIKQHGVRKNMVCPKDYYSAALAVHPGLTYHFYRQDKTGYWSHKDGATDAKQWDASGKNIIDPQKANRHYVNKSIDGKIVNYKDFCGYFCVPKDKQNKFWQSGVTPRS
jgi:hypothetical protein